MKQKMSTLQTPFTSYVFQVETEMTGTCGLWHYSPQKLGAKFDIKRFHDEALDSGPLPLDVLHARVEAWIAKQAAQYSLGGRFASQSIFDFL